ncbi:hypothetical protein [Methylobacterium sp. JK268]
MSAPVTIGDLLRAGIVTEEQLNAAVKSFLADGSTTRREIASGITVDIGAAVAAEPRLARLAIDETTDETMKRMAIGFAILLARPA